MSKSFAGSVPARPAKPAGFRAALVRRLCTAYHNCVLHPVAGVLWFLGLEAAGDRVHGEPKPRWMTVLLDGPEAPRIDPVPVIHPPAAPHLHVYQGRLLAATVFAADPAAAYHTALALVVSASRTRPWESDRVL